MYFLRNIILIFSAIGVVSCSVTTEGSLSGVAASACIQEGGSIRKVGRLQYEACILEYVDSGKECLDPSECEGRCLVYGHTEKKGSVTTGRCETNNSGFGCFTEIENGMVKRSICVD